MPTISPCSGDQPERRPRPERQRDRQQDAEGPPTSATHFTRNRSFSENSSPMQNMRRTTPISAKASKLWVEATADRGEGADGHAAEHVAENQRLTRLPGERAADHRRQQDEGEVAEEDRIAGHAPAR